jgi:hypothetical protein
MLVKRSLNLSAKEAKSWNAVLRLVSEPLALANGLTLTLSTDSEVHAGGIEHWATVLGRYRLRFRLKQLPPNPSSKAILEPQRAAELPSGIRALLQERTTQTVMDTLTQITGVDIARMLDFTYGGETARTSETNDDINWSLDIRQGDETILSADVSLSMRAGIAVAYAMGFTAPVSDDLPDTEVMSVGLRIASFPLPATDVEGLETGDLVVMGTLEHHVRQLSISGQLYSILPGKDGQPRLELTP